MTVKPKFCHGPPLQPCHTPAYKPLTQAAGSGGHCRPSEGFCRGLGESRCALEFSVPRKRTLELGGAGDSGQRRMRLLSVVSLWAEEVGSDAGRTEGITCGGSLNCISLLYCPRPVVFAGPPLTGPNTVVRQMQ